MDDESARRALERFGLKPDELITPPLARRRKRAVWRAGAFALKWFAYPEQAEKVAAVSRYLHARGVPLPVPRAPEIAATGAGAFLLFPWIDGRMPSYAEPGMTEALTGLLARFHQASAGYPHAVPSLVNWERLWADQRHWLHKAAEIADGRPDDAFSRRVKEALPWLRARLRWCQQHLPELPQGEPLLGHGDYSRQNVIATPDGGLVVFDLDQVSHSLCVRDLSRLITWVNHDLQNWSAERFERIVAAYGELTQAERALLELDQVMPHLAIDITRDYYSGARPTHLEELERCLATDEAKLKDLGLGP